ncbi:NUDIX domain-containing protein [Longispora albida]|uniref:NUDIX domain-containing protein n=1 Tax=Longispora albida TaxID=203523 RepID=UPI00035E08BF
MSEPVTYTHPDVFTTGVEQGWAERETNPAAIDWPARQAVAAIPFEVVDGRPVNPCASTGIRYGRNNLGLWGENLMADALVTARYDGGLYVLMVERADGHGWAVPGGAVDPGETGLDGAIRELEEETGLTVDPLLWTVSEARYVPDPRGSDEAWAVTVAASAFLGTVLNLPAVRGCDDARRAEWVRADSRAALEEDLAQRFGGQIFAAHVDLVDAIWQEQQPVAAVAGVPVLVRQAGPCETGGLHQVARGESSVLVLTAGGQRTADNGVEVALSGCEGCGAVLLEVGSFWTGSPFVVLEIGGAGLEARP